MVTPWSFTPEVAGSNYPLFIYLLLDFWWCLPWVSKPGCMFYCICTMDSSDSPLVQHMLPSWWPAWQLSHFIQVLHTSIGGSRVQDQACRCLTNISGHFICLTFRENSNQLSRRSLMTARLDVLYIFRIVTVKLSIVSPEGKVELPEETMNGMSIFRLQLWKMSGLSSIQCP